MTRKSRNVRGGYRPPPNSNTALASPITPMGQALSSETASVTQPESSTTNSTDVAAMVQPVVASSSKIFGGSTTKPRPRPTHFLCIPLADTESTRSSWQSALTRFDEQVRQKLRGFDQIPPGCVRPAGTMHLTLGIMSLNEADVQKAGELLGGAVERAWRRANEEKTDSQKQNVEPLDISLKSLVAMTRPKTSVLFADPIDSSGRLRPFCQALKEEFENAGLMEKEDRELKLHATVLNTIYSKMPRKIRNPPPKKFDPTPLLAACEDFEWLDLRIEKVAICRMGAINVYDDDGKTIDEKYQAVEQVNMPAL